MKNKNIQPGPKNNIFTKVYLLIFSAQLSKCCRGHVVLLQER